MTTSIWFSNVSRYVIALIKILPTPIGIFAYRGYNKFIKLIGSRYLAKTFFGAIIPCDAHDQIQSMIFHFGIWEPEISYLTIELLGEGDVYVDVGANIGYDTLLASSLVGSSGKVVSIEPAPAIFRRLTANVRGNGANNVRLVDFAVSDRQQTVTLYAASKYNLGTTTTIASRGQPVQANVQALPLDQILEPEEISRTRLIKIDIEGAELPVLHRFLDTLELYPLKTLIIVEASIQDAPSNWQRVLTRFQTAGFAAYEIENHYTIEWYLKWRGPSALKPVTSVPSTQTDLLFSREQFPSTLLS